MPMPMCEQSELSARPGRWAALAGALAGSLVVITSAVALSGTTEAGLTDSEVVLEYTVTGPGKAPGVVPPPSEAPSSSTKPARPEASSSSAPSEWKATGGDQRSQAPPPSGDRSEQSQPAGDGAQTSPGTSRGTSPKVAPDPSPVRQPESEACPDSTSPDGSTDPGKAEQTCVEEVPSDGTEQ